MLIAGLTLIGAGLWLAYKAGADHTDRDRWQTSQQYEQALAPSRVRHPAGRDA